MIYAKTLATTHEAEFLRFRKLTADARELDTDPLTSTTWSSWTAGPTGSCPTAGACCRRRQRCEQG